MRTGRRPLLPEHTPDAGTTQSSSSKTDSANYSSFDEMLAAYQADIAEIEAGDAYGNSIAEFTIR